MFTVQVGDNDPTGTRTYTLIDDFNTVAIVEADALSTFVEWLTNPPVAPDPTPAAEEESATEDVTEEASTEATDEPTEETTEVAPSEATPTAEAESGP